MKQILRKEGDSPIIIQGIEIIRIAKGLSPSYISGAKIVNSRQPLFDSG